MTRPGGSRVPKEALLLSLLSLLVPVTASAALPDWTTGDVGVLIWLLALVPGFLLSYYRGWTGSAVALAAGMAAFALAQVWIVVTGASEPGPELVLGVVVVLIGVSLGSGWLSGVFHRSLEEAEAMALTDALTGISNRRRATMHLERAFGAAERGIGLVAVLWDLDRFKEVNDEYGHAVGDQVLREFGRLLHGHTRAMDVSARWGGEEFISILSDSNAQGALIFADRVRERFKSLDLPCGQVTVSGGIAQYEPGMASPDVLVAAADQALYRAKGAGRDRITVLARQGRQAPAVTGAHRAPQAGPSEEAGAMPRGGGERVLVVDDDPAALRSLVRALRRIGYEAVPAPSPREAVERFRAQKGPVDLLVTDLIMPETSGFRLVEILSRFQDELRVLYISGYSAKDVDWAGVPGAAWAYLAKPISIDDLAVKARAVLDAPPLPAREVEAAGER